ncbi:response regulator [Mucilaginibacter sp.]|jgi:CheY-like chemotaxis protein|uniref:response regulator n=1 Tax=Mucilaginibacter sp. TaxID=1882438 RepID=UPI0025EB19D2|nr:response regulator [Mucilaginibacter sp.]
MNLNEPQPTIMLIDDVELDNIIFKMVLQRLLPNPTIDTCANGQRAIEKLRLLTDNSSSLMPDYIFLDLRMPVMDGWQFLKEFAELAITPEKRSKLFVLSSTIDKNEIQDSIENPLVSDFLSKPIGLDKLKSIFTT